MRGRYSSFALCPRDLWLSLVLILSYREQNTEPCAKVDPHRDRNNGHANSLHDHDRRYGFIQRELKVISHRWVRREADSFGDAGRRQQQRATIFLLSEYVTAQQLYPSG